MLGPDGTPNLLLLPQYVATSEAAEALAQHIMAPVEELGINLSASDDHLRQGLPNVSRHEQAATSLAVWPQCVLNLHAQDGMPRS